MPTIVGTNGDDSLDGTTGADLIQGLDGNDLIIGHGGGDRIEGGAGDDVMVVFEPADEVIEDAGAGSDIVYTYADHQLSPGSHVERLSAVDWTFTTPLSLTGNELANLIEGNAGANFLDGRDGADRMVGFEGDDVYIVDDAGDQAIETSGQGSDTVYALADYQLVFGSEIERLSAIDWTLANALNLAGNELANLIEGNAGANFLNGGGGADRMVGFGGNDIYIVDDAGDQVIETAGQGSDVVYALADYGLTAGSSIERLSAIDWRFTTPLSLAGNELDNLIEGNAGANVLNGGGGADRMLGFGGDDVYIVDNAGDQVIETASQDSYDTVYALVDYALPLGMPIERLSAIDWTSTTPLNLRGNARANLIEGNAGANILDGGGGNDVLVGFGGDDTYYVDALNAQVFESAGGGNDAVYISFSFTLGAGQEIELLSAREITANVAFNLTGNEFVNRIVGNAAENILDGKGGSDTLVGNAGPDTFQFTTALGAGNVDTIADFVHGTDKIALDDAIFTGLVFGPLSANAFATGSQAGDADDRIIYDSATGQLFFDADGNGAGAAIQFATPSPGLALTASDFTVI
jgi:Ca2+-binding RTX toxin-like protein